MKLINLCPHDVMIVNADAKIITLAKCGNPIRFGNVESGRLEYKGILIVETELLTNLSLPRPVQNVIYIVPQVVRIHFPNRSDLASPYDVIRTPEGHPIACRALAVNPPTVALEIN